MRFLLTVFILTIYSTTFAQQQSQNDSIYIIQDSVLIPTKSGFDISAIIVRKKQIQAHYQQSCFTQPIIRMQVMQYLQKKRLTEIMLA